MQGYTQLTQEERYQIDKRLAQDWSFGDIARELERSKSTISRELRRNRSLCGYQPAVADRLARNRRNRRGRPRIRGQDWRRVKRLLRRKLSPEQIRNRLRLEGGRAISHSWIYRFVRLDRQAGGKLHTYLRHQGRRRRRYGSGSVRGLIPGRVSIHERPAVVEQRSRIGDWEIDTIIGRGHRGALLSLTERSSNWLLLAKLRARTAEEVLYAALGLLMPHVERVHTITSDNGREFTLHGEIASGLAARCYFADAYCAWQRGTNEHTNGLVRQYFPRTRNFLTIRQSEIDHAAHELNSRPRKKLAWRTPDEVFCGISQVVALAS
jgi:IS30 family transposase